MAYSAPQAGIQRRDHHYAEVNYELRSIMNYRCGIP
jgi:hypothetical protein